MDSIFIIYTVTDHGDTFIIDSSWTDRGKADKRCDECNNGVEYPAYYGFKVEEVSLNCVAKKAGYNGYSGIIS